MDITVDAEINLYLNNIPKEEWDDIAKRVNDLPNLTNFEYVKDDGYIGFETDILVEDYDVSFEICSYDGWDAVRGEYREYGKHYEPLVEDLIMNTPEKDILNINKSIVIDMYYNRDMVEDEIKEYIMEM